MQEILELTRLREADRRRLQTLTGTCLTLERQYYALRQRQASGVREQAGIQASVDILAGLIQDTVVNLKSQGSRSPEAAAAPV